MTQQNFGQQPGAQGFNPYAQPGQYGGNPYGQQPQYQQQPQNFGQQAGYQQQPQQTQQQSAPAQGHQHAPDFDDAADPSGFGGLFARPRHLVGRVVIYMPKRVDDKAKGLDGQAKDTPNVHGDLIVVDGGMIEFGDKQKSGGVIERPNTHRVMAPAFFKNVIVGESQVALALQQAAPPFGNGLMVGVIVRGQKGNNPYLLQTLERDDPRRQTARQLYDAWRSGAWQSPEPEPIQVVPGSMAAGQAQGFGQQPAQNVAGGFGQAQGQWGQPQNVGGATVTGWIGQTAPQSAPPAQWGGQQAQGFDQSGFGSEQWRQPAPGWDPNMWAQMPDANKQQVWAALQAQQNGQQQMANPGSTSGPTGF